MKWTEAQQEAIELRDKNILVSAAAGSGKTAVLVERIKKLLLIDRISLDEMLIVTFSNAAASEMREKIIKSLSEEISKGDNKTESFARHQLSNIHRANISTFHAFSIEVIKRYFHLIDRDPNFKICDDAQKSILQSKAMEQLFHSLFDAEDLDFLWFLGEYGSAKNDNDVKNMILETHNFIKSIPNSFGWLDERVEQLKAQGEDFFKGNVVKEIKTNIFTELKQCWESLTRVGQLLEDYGLEGLYAKWKLEAEEIENLVKVFSNQDMGNEDLQKGLNLMRDIKFQTYRAGSAEKADYEEIKEEVSSLRDQGKGIIKKLNLNYTIKPLGEYLTEINGTYRAAACLSSLVKAFDRLFREEKDEKALIDFNDIEHFGLDILAHEEAASEYREKFKYIFVDEYQDSNLVQETLISQIKRENNLFMVGDVKQSIYKFRLAEPEIFIKKYEAFKNEKNDKNKAIDLNENFRSKGNIINGVNDVFSRIMTKAVTGLEYDDAASLHQGVTYNGGLEYPVELHLVDDKIAEDEDIDDEIADMKKMEVEAYHGAEIIKASLGQPYFNIKANESRPLKMRDIVILLRGAKGTAELYAEALSKQGIPSFVDVSDGYFDTVEIEVFLNLLRVIVNYKQDIPLISVLKSPIFNFSLQELIQLRIENRKTSYEKAFFNYGNEGETLNLREKCKNTFEQINRWAKESSFMPLEDFLWKLMRETGYSVYVGALPGGVQRQANLRALIDKAVQFQNSQGKGLFQFILYIEAVTKEKVSMGQVKLLGEKDDVIRIMTIHKSKGLEFPMVLLGGLGKRFRGETQKNFLSLHKELGIGICLMDRKNNNYKKTLLQSAINSKKGKEERAEEIRVLYVAFTRAMDKLVLLGSQSSGTSYLSFLTPVLEETKINVINRGRNQVLKEARGRNERLDRIKDILGSSSKALNIPLKSVIYKRLDQGYAEHVQQQQARGQTTLKSKFSVSELNKLGNGKVEDLTVPKLNLPLFRQNEKEFTPAEKGTILHSFMERMNFKAMLNKENRTIKYLTSLLENFVIQEILLETEAETVDVNKVLNFFNSNIGNRAMRAESLFKEESFNLIKDYEGQKIIVQGTIDCYFEEGDKYVLLDYKSNYLKGAQDGEAIDALVENYRGQLEIYKEALEKIRGKQVKEMYLYLFSIDREICVSEEM